MVISIEGGAESRTCEGETITVNLHRSLIATAKAPEGTGIGHCASVLGTDGTFEDLTAQMFQFRTRKSGSAYKPIRGRDWLTC